MAGTACQQRFEAAGDSTSPVGDADREEYPLLSWLFVFSLRPKPQPIIVVPPTLSVSHPILVNPN